MKVQKLLETLQMWYKRSKETASCTFQQVHHANLTVMISHSIIMKLFSQNTNKLRISTNKFWNSSSRAIATANSSSLAPIDRPWKESENMKTKITANSHTDLAMFLSKTINNSNLWIPMPPLWAPISNLALAYSICKPQSTRLLRYNSKHQGNHLKESKSHSLFLFQISMLNPFSPFL